MDTLLSHTTSDDRRDLFAATAARMGIDERLIEKDFWVCWMLRRLFALPDIGDHLTFKGGTSLSKAFGLIARFSEDIDLIVERSWLGVPDAPTGSHRQWINKIKDACRKKVKDTLYPRLKDELTARLLGGSWDLIAEQTSNEDPRELRFVYPSVLPATPGGYVRPEIKMEFTARSEGEPAVLANVQPYAATEFPKMFTTAETALRCLAPERTLFEKATLLHEELLRPIESGVRPRLSRHFYDLAQMHARGLGERALANLALYEGVVRHRAAFFAVGWMGDYSTLIDGPLILQPAEDRRAAWKRDYDDMKVMLFHEPPPFEDLLATAGAFAASLNAARGLKG